MEKEILLEVVAWFLGRVPSQEELNDNIELLKEKQLDLRDPYDP